MITQPNFSQRLLFNETIMRELEQGGVAPAAGNLQHQNLVTQFYIKETISPRAYAMFANQLRATNNIENRSKTPDLPKAGAFMTSVDT